MFHLLYPWLREIYFPFNVLRYITVRAAFAAITAFVLSLLLGPPLIRWLKKHKMEEKVAKGDAPALDKLHRRKEGTPTMGGILILTTIILSTLLWADLANRFIVLLLTLTLCLGGIGFLDDWMKLHHRSGGMGGRYKFLLQMVLGLIIGLYLYQFPGRFAPLWRYQVVNSAYSPFLASDFATRISLPFLKDVFLPLSYFYILFVALIIVGSSNAVNLTDGLDGLAIGSTLFVALIYAIIAYLAGNWKTSQYLGILFVEGSGELTVFCSAIVGTALGFLWFNAYPADIFMGDTGALALGGALGAIAVLVKHELLLLIVGGIFVLEAGSVMMQVGSFRLRKKRILAIAPLHHHLEMKGWAEPKVVVRFWIIMAILALLTLSSLKLR